MDEKQPDDVEPLAEDVGADSCEFVDFDADTLERCGDVDDAQEYSIRGVSVTLCEPHLEDVLVDEGLVDGRADAGRAA